MSTTKIIVDTAVEVFVNAVPLLDDTDFKTRETAVAYNASGMDLVWNFQTPAGVVSQTAVTPTTGGTYDWTHVGDAMYKIEIPASGGASINNDTEGVGWFSGVATGVLPWVSPRYEFVPANVANSLVLGTDKLEVDMTQLGGAAQSATDLKDFADDGYDPSTNKVQGVVLVDTATAVTTVNGLAANSLTAAAAATDFVEEIRNSITGGAYALSSDANGRLRIVDGTGVGELDTDSGTVLLRSATETQIDNIQSAIGAAGAGLSAIPWNAAWDAEVQSEVNDGLVALGLDHLLAASVAGTDVTDNSIIARLVSKSATADWDSFNNQTDALEAIRDNLPAAAPSAASIADAVWEEAIADHSGTAGSTAEALNAAGSAGDPWTTALPGAYSAGQAGKIIGDNLNATVSSRSSHAAADVWSVATRLLTAGTNIALAKGVGVTGFNDLDAAGIRAAVGLSSANLDTQIDGLPTRAEITGGNYALNTDANGNVRIVDGTGTGELDTLSGTVLLRSATETQIDDIQTAIAGLNNLSAAQVLQTALTESYAANGVAPTLTQAVLAIHQMLMDFSISGTTWQVKRLDSTTNAFAATLNDATNPTAIERV